MSRVGTIQVALRLPCEAGMWPAILDLDRSGPWSIVAVAERTGCGSGTAHDFVRRLEAGGYAECLGRSAKSVKRTHLSAPVVYRLLKSPAEAPRLERDGSPRPTPDVDQLWRAMKMLKRFTAEELAEACNGVTLSAARRYSQQLTAGGVLRQLRSVGKWQLVKNLGAGAPTVMTTTLVFDPNRDKVVKASILREVKP